MRRWLLAVLVMPLLWNTVGPAVTAWGEPVPGSDHPTVWVTALDAQIKDGKGLSDQAHGLLDELPDLPDSLLRRPLAKPLPPPQPERIARATPPLDSTHPEGLLRPPQPWV